ncbi:uncharacterized protein LOC135497832 isoform X3 [Lineus longissimus]|uniref:uncharacterized protein LOC135497832 isoform X3 n=1 Tax=Lineus longissimus TaxID=88925 RepID=UPI002B4CE129
MASIRVLLEAFGDAGRPLSKSPDVTSATNLVRLCYFVVLISYALCAGDEECLVAKNIKCYECSTLKGDKFCADPFNASHPNAQAKNCEGACAKWVRIPKQGAVHYIRTCSATLNMQMHVSLVCMKESRPGDGHLCFCKSKKCNGATRPSADYFGTAMVVIIALLTLLFNNRKTLDGIEDFVQCLNQDASKPHAQSRKKNQWLDSETKWPTGKTEQVICPDVNRLWSLQRSADNCVESTSSAPSLDALYNDGGHHGVKKRDLNYAALEPNIREPDPRCTGLQTLSARGPYLLHQSKSSLQLRTSGYSSM